MKSTTTTFLLGALVGAALALGLRAAILSSDDGSQNRHADHAESGGMPDHDADMNRNTPEPPAAPAPAGLLIDLGNESCPIMGGSVNGRTWSEWNGLRVGHCCPPCVADFLEDPEKALDEAGIEWREAAKLAAEIQAAAGEERKRLLAEVREKYDVVRRPEGER